jgi:hypothetical protein
MRLLQSRANTHADGMNLSAGLCTSLRGDRKGDTSGETQIPEEMPAVFAPRQRGVAARQVW